MAAAYMREHAQACEEWYVYNAGLREPLLGPYDARCRCLPRHGPQRCLHPISAEAAASEVVATVMATEAAAAEAAAEAAAAMMATER